jgi:hypothetical protein
MSARAEAQRQQALMAAILRRGDEPALNALLAKRPDGAARGMEAYQANAGASAERALATAFPTVQALMGEESFAALARAHWQACPPERGDLALFGDQLPDFIAASEQLADVPYLADSARLDWRLAESERAADAEVDLSTLGLLSEAEPTRLRLALMPGTAVLDSAYPVVSLWQAHQPGAEAEAARDKVRAALQSGQGEHAVVSRARWRAQAFAIDAATARWMHRLLRGDVLSSALGAAGPGFDIEAWLVLALQRQWLWRADVA